VRVLFGGQARDTSSPVSIVGMARVAGQAAQRVGFGEILALLASVNLLVGFINLLPLPPFDGGHLAVLAVEKVRGRKVDTRKLVPVAAVVLSFFVLVSFAAIYLDIFKPIDLFP
jgi:membrane-associated protease RseP (regulator of RpoE activity)